MNRNGFLPIETLLAFAASAAAQPSFLLIVSVDNDPSWAPMATPSPERPTSTSWQPRADPLTVPSRRRFDLSHFLP